MSDSPRSDLDPKAGGPPATPEVPDFGPGALDRAVELVHFLRGNCPWDAEQTPRSLIPHLLEESQEVVDAIREDDHHALEGELGDLLLNLAFQIAIAEEEGHFDRAAVSGHLEEKMIRRHPHLFGLGERRDWEELKAEERARAEERRREAEIDSDGASAPATPAPSVLDGVAKGLGPLLRAHRIQDRVARIGFDWNDVSGAFEKAREELAEVGEALDGTDAEHLDEELGDLLFAVVNVVRLAGRNSDPLLDAANRKFERRFRALETLARDRGIEMASAGLDALDELWDEVKERERSAESSAGQ